MKRTWTIRTGLILCFTLIGGLGSWLNQQRNQIPIPQGPSLSESPWKSDATSPQMPDTFAKGIKNIELDAHWDRHYAVLRFSHALLEKLDSSGRPYQRTLQHLWGKIDAQGMALLEDPQLPNYQARLVCHLPSQCRSYHLTIERSEASSRGTAIMSSTWIRGGYLTIETTEPKLNETSTPFLKAMGWLKCLNHNCSATPAMWEQKYPIELRITRVIDGHDFLSLKIPVPKNEPLSIQIEGPLGEPGQATLNWTETTRCNLSATYIASTQDLSLTCTEAAHSFKLKRRTAY